MTERCAPTLSAGVAEVHELVAVHAHQPVERRAGDTRFRVDPDGDAWVNVEDLRSLCRMAAAKYRGQPDAAAAYQAVGDGIAQAARLSVDRDAVADCGCPIQVIADEGHQEGCDLYVP